MPGIKLITEESEKDVTLLEDVDPQYVSLVRHGANRMPFRVVKQEKGGDKNKMPLAIQSLILPKGVKLEDITSVKGLEYLTDAKLDQKQEFEDYDKLHQLDSKMFESESMQLLKVGNGWLLVGKLSEKAEGGKDALTLSDEQVEKLAAIPVAPMDSIIGDPDVAAQAAIVSSFRDMFHRELSAMLDVVHGSLQQAATDPKKRKNTVISAVDGFKQFLSVGLDAIGTNSTKINKEVKIEIGGGDEMDLKSQEFKDAVVEIVTESVKPIQDGIADIVKKLEDKPPTDDKTDADKTDDDKTDDDKTDDDKDDKTDDDKGDSEEVKALKTTVKDLSEKVEKIGNQLQQDSSASDADDDDSTQDDATQDDKDKPSVFKGLLVKADKKKK